MSKTRTPEQKARRAYLAKCAKEGRKPLGMEAWKGECAKVLAKAKKAVADIKAKDKPATKKPEAKKPVTKKPAKAPAKKIAAKRAKVHEIHKGDVIKFIDFDAKRVLRYATRLLCLAVAEVSK